MAFQTRLGPSLLCSLGQVVAVEIFLVSSDLLSPELISGGLSCLSRIGPNLSSRSRCTLASRSRLSFAPALDRVNSRVVSDGRRCRAVSDRSVPCYLGLGHAGRISQDRIDQHCQDRVRYISTGLLTPAYISDWTEAAPDSSLPRSAQLRSGQTGVSLCSGSDQHSSDSERYLDQHTLIRIIINIFGRG